MAEAGISGGSEQRIMISDTYLATHATDAGSGADIDLINLSPVEAFLNLTTAQGRGIVKSGVNGKYGPRAVSVNTAGNINAEALNDKDFLVETKVAGVLHSNRYKAIRPNGTTARGIIIHA